MLGFGPIYWSSKKKATLALSSTESKYRGVVNATIQDVRRHGILIEFGIHTSPSIEIYCDNQSTIKISNDLVQKKNTKNIDVHVHYIRELVHENTIKMHYYPIEE